MNERSDRFVPLAAAVLAVIFPFMVFGWMAFSHRNDPDIFINRTARDNQMEDRVEKLQINMELWKTMTWLQKEKTVYMAIMIFQRNFNAAILQSPAFYVQKIDEFLRRYPDAWDKSILAVLRYLAVDEFDFYNGEDKDQLARRMLGEKRYKIRKNLMGGISDSMMENADGHW